MRDVACRSTASTKAVAAVGFVLLVLLSACTGLTVPDEVEGRLSATTTTRDMVLEINLWANAEGACHVGSPYALECVDAGIHLADDAVTEEGRVELLHYLCEQAIRTTLHRHGNVLR